jgi:hypothetical protein
MALIVGLLQRPELRSWRGAAAQKKETLVLVSAALPPKPAPTPSLGSGRSPRRSPLALIDPDPLSVYYDRALLRAPLPQYLPGLRRIIPVV